MNAEYNKLITETFCDNAIRSVMMIDDDYTPYHKFVEVAEKANNLSEVKNILKASNRASLMQKFFEQQKFICDISNGVDYFDPEKARKSDLLILDYQLENDSPELSLSIIRKLSQTKHMNLVVIYTNEDLKRVWLEIASSMNGYNSIDIENNISDDNFKSIWNEKTNGGDELPEEWDHFIDDDIAQFLKGKKPNFDAFSKRLANEYKKHTKDIYCSSIAMKCQQLDMLKEEFNSIEIQGSFNGNLWLKFGNIFISLHKKIDTEPASAIWDSLKKSLIDWQPNYFRLISSEIQNQIENGGVTLNKYLNEDYYSQSAWLWQVLKNWENRHVELRKLLENNTDSFKDNVILNAEVMTFAEKICSQFIENFPQTQNKDENKDDAQIRYVVKHASKTLKAELPELSSKIVHSLNCSLSTKDFTSTYITTGTLLHNEDEDSWLLCVTPACDTVPEQNNTCLSKRLAPNFKLLKFIKFSRVKQKSALSKATDGVYLFIDNDITLQTSSNPNLEYAISHKKAENSPTFMLTVFKTDILVNEIVSSEAQVITSIQNFTIKAQLKDSYAARYQALASHHTGRIGVDFIKFE